MPEKESFNPELNREGGFESERQPENQEEYFQAIEATLNKEYNERNPKLSETERDLHDLIDEEGKVVARVDKIRNLTYEAELDPRRTDMWFVVDFDDVINHTTEFNSKVMEFVMSETGMTAEEYKEIYESSKLENNFGKKVLRFEEMKNVLESKYPGIQEKMDNFMESVDYNQFVDQGVKRFLQSLHVSDQQSKISILTFGDTDYQKFRIDRTDLSDIVDEVIYTESSKRDVVQRLYKEQVQKEQARRDRLRAEQDIQYFTGPINRFTVMIDDSPDHIDDYNITELEREYEINGKKDTAIDKFANIRYNNPQAKRFGKPTKTEKVLEASESLTPGDVIKNSGAIDLHLQARLLHWYGDLSQSEDREKIFELLKDREKNKEELGRLGWLWNDEDIRYEKDEEGNFTYKANRMYYRERRDGGTFTRPYEFELGSKGDDGAFDVSKILPDPNKKGMISRRKPIREFNFLEYIKNAP